MHISPSRLFRAGFLVVLASGSLLHSASAQRTEDALATLLSARSSAQGSVPSEFAQEGAIDADRYLIGPGDVFALSIGGAQPTQVQAPVTADGMLMLPDVGGIEVDGLTLRVARERILRAIQPLYRNVPVAVALAQPRRFLIHIGGAVDDPGRKTVGPLARLSDAVTALRPTRTNTTTTLADGTTVTEQSETPSATIAPSFARHLRAVEIRREGQPTQTFDLMRYRRTGDPDLNPYLRDGDRVYVPTYHTTRDVVFVSGAVPYPGAYPVRDDDTAADLVAIAGGSTEGVRIRIAGQPRDAASGTTQVEAGATVFVEADRQLGIVVVDGEVAYPGSYRVVPGVTTARGLLEQAGGLLPTALGRGSYIQRKGADGVNRDDTPIQRAVATPGDLPFVTRASLANQIATPSIGVPAVTWLGDGATEIPLFDGDRLFVPRDEGTVLVTGGVARPGYLPVQPGASPSDYLASAGGLRRNVRDVYVLRAGTQELVDASDAGTLQSGDLILVTTDDPATQPDLFGLSLQQRTLELQVDRDRRESRFRTVSTGLAIVGTVTSIVTTYLLISRD